MVADRWSVVGVTVVGGWSVGGGFVLRRFSIRGALIFHVFDNNTLLSSLLKILYHYT